ncbi:uncharacterized protein [Dysidea avara]|uniref:uncharacterized protein n=1 Tax=Dysidea avara TaxID=196820 RepID=UPI0033196455
MNLNTEEMDVSGIKGASIDARIGGVLGDISSMKRGKSASYFDGEISDEQKKIRLYGFDSSVRKRLFEETGKAVVLGNCEVKKARHGNEYEVLVSKKTTIEKSPRKYDVQKIDDDCNTALSNLSDIPEYTKVTCEGKVIEVDNVVETANGIKLQSVTIADRSGTARIVLWGDDVNMLSSSKCYKFEKVIVKEFHGETQLSVSKSKIDEIDDIDAVNIREQEKVHTIDEAKVLGVQLFEVYKACLNCRSKLPHGIEGEFDTCSRCGMLQCTDECKTEATAQMMIRSESSSSVVTLKAFGRSLQEIAGEEVSSPLALLKATPFSATHQHGVIQSVTRV